MSAGTFSDIEAIFSNSYMVQIVSTTVNVFPLIILFPVTVDSRYLEFQGTL